MVELIENRLRELQIEHEVFPCDPEFADTAAFCEKYGFAANDSANTILVSTKADEPEFVACMVLATDRLDVNSKVRKKMEARKVSFASADDTVELTGMQIGGVTVVGLPGDLRIWIDEAVMARDKIVIGGGTRDCKILLAPQELLKLPNVQVANLTKE